MLKIVQICFRALLWLSISLPAQPAPSGINVDALRCVTCELSVTSDLVILFQGGGGDTQTICHPNGLVEFLIENRQVLSVHVKDCAFLYTWRQL